MDRIQAITVISGAGYGAELDRLLELLVQRPNRTACCLAAARRVAGQSPMPVALVYDDGASTASLPAGIAMDNDDGTTTVVVTRPIPGRARLELGTSHEITRQRRSEPCREEP